MQPQRQQFHRAHTSSGVHWMKMIGLATPLIIGEFVADPGKRWKWTRLAILVTAAIEEIHWTHKIKRERDECERAR